MHGELHGVLVDLWSGSGDGVQQELQTVLHLVRRLFLFPSSCLLSFVQHGRQRAWGNFSYPSLTVLPPLLSLFPLTLSPVPLPFALRRYAFFSLTPAAHGIALYSTLGSQRNIEDYLGPSIDIPGSEILKVHVSAISTTVSRPATVPHLLLQPPAWRDHGGRAERTTTAGLEREWDGGVGSLRTRAREEKEDGDDDRTRVHGMV